MKLIIDIHEKDYESLKHGNVTYSIIYAIINGTPLEEYCNICESGNPCLYCKHKFEEVEESEDD